MVKNLVNKYWAEILVIGLISIVLLIDLIPDITWINTDCDGPHYIYSAKYLYPAHKTSAPLFLLLGHLFVKIPIGTEAWRFALLSGISTIIACIFIYLIIKNRTHNKWIGLVGSLIYGGSALVISQSIIIETYALVTMFGILAFYFAEKKRWICCAIMLGAGGAVHHLIGIPILILLIFNRDLRRWKPLLIMGSFLLFYLYIPITNRPPYMWQSETSKLGISFFVDNLSTMLMLWGGISIWDFPKRAIDTIGLVGLSLGLAVVPIVVMLKKWKDPLFWMFILPIIYYMTNLAPQTYVYVMPSIAFGAIIAGDGLTKMKWQWTLAVGIIAVTLLTLNNSYFDVGRTLDKNLSARQFYNELDNIPDNTIFLPKQGWEWAIVYLYNREEGRNIIPVCVGTLASVQYQDTLHNMGIKFDGINDTEAKEMGITLLERQNLITESIIANNPNTWTSVITEPETYGAKVIKTDPNNIEHLLNDNYNVDTKNIDWKWKPSNPYNIITGAIEVNEWVYIVLSNFSLLTFGMLGVIGVVPAWFLWSIVVRKKRWHFSSAREKLGEI